MDFVEFVFVKILICAMIFVVIVGKVWMGGEGDSFGF